MEDKEANMILRFCPLCAIVIAAAVAAASFFGVEIVDTKSNSAVACWLRGGMTDRIWHEDGSRELICSVTPSSLSGR